MSDKTRTIFYSALAAISASGIVTSIVHHNSFFAALNGALLANWIYKLVRATKTDG